MGVPNIFPETEALPANPPMMYMSDEFQKPMPFQADVVIAIDEVVDRKIDALDRHTSQVYEWLAWHGGRQERVPSGDDARAAWLRERYTPESARVADRFRERLIARYGVEKGRAVKYAEALEICEYGGALTEEKIEELFAGM